MDYQLFHLLNQLAGRFDGADDIFERVASTGPLILVALLAGMWFWPGPRPARADRQWACIAAAISAALALGLNQIIIRLWARPRPFDSHHVVLLLKPSHDPSFPSDHATFAFAVAVSILLVSRRIGIWALAIAIVLAVSRVYVGEHYFGDVAAGAAIGSAMAYAVNQARPILMPLLERPMDLARRLHLA
jgi:undecaprenyl-diphosphatase